MKKILVYFYFIPFSFLIAQQELTLEEIIKIGLQNNFDIQIARKNTEISSNNSRLGTSGFLPTLDLSGSYLLSQSDQETNSPFSFGDSDTETFGGEVSLNWTIFDGFKMFVDNVRFKELEKLGEFQTKNIIENNVVSIARSYFNLVQQEQLLDVAKNTLDISNDRLNKARVRKEVGGASSTDFLNAQVSFNNDKSSLLQRELEVEIAAKDLNVLLGGNPDDDVNVKKEIIVPELTYTFEEISSLALEKNSNLTVAKQNMIVANKDVSVNRSFFFPRVALNGSYGYSDRTVSSDNPNFAGDVTTQSTDGSVALTFSFNLFNGFRNDIDLQSAKIQADIQEIALKKAENDLLGNLKEKYDTYLKQLEFIQLEEQNEIAAQQNLQLQNERYQTGAATSLEFRDAQVNLARAQNALIVARYQARITLLEIEQLIGEMKVE